LRKVEGREFTLRIQKNSQDSVRILNESALPMAYCKVEARIGGVLWGTLLAYLPEELERSLEACIQETRPDTEAIKAVVLRNEEVAGAEVRGGSLCAWPDLYFAAVVLSSWGIAPRTCERNEILQRRRLLRNIGPHPRLNWHGRCHLLVRHAAHAGNRHPHGSRCSTETNICHDP